MRISLHQVSLLAVVLAGTGLPASAAAPGGLLDTRPRVDDERLRDVLQEVRREHDVPGLAAAVFDRDTLRAFGVGELTPDGAPVTPESRFRVGQVSVLFTGMATAALITDGSIPSGEDEMRHLAPEIDLHNPWSGERPVHVADLLTHRAGLGATHFRDVLVESPDQPLLASINSAFRALRVEYRPGEREQYSVVGPAIAAYLVEKAAGFPYEEVLERMIFEPLQSTAGIGRADGPLPGDATGHAGWPARAVSPARLNFATAGGMWISAKDLALTGQMLLNRGRDKDRVVLSPEAVAWLEAAPSDDRALVPGSRRGVHAEEHNGFVFHTQTGALPGFLARFAYSPELGGGYVVLLNHGGAREALAHADMLLRGQLMDGRRAPPVPLPVAELETGSLAGWYRKVNAEPPQRRLYQPWLTVARMDRCEEYWCLAMAEGTRVLQAFDARRLREQGKWAPGWEVRVADTVLLLDHAAERWRRVPGWQVLGALGAAAVVLAGTLVGVVLLPAWTVSMIRRRATDYRELLPRFMPLLAIAAVVVLQVLLFTTGYPALGTVSAASITILVLSIAVPLLAALALATAAMGVAWKLPLRTTVPAICIALASMIAAVAMVSTGLLAFQAWNY